MISCLRAASASLSGPSRNSVDSTVHRGPRGFVETVAPIGVRARRWRPDRRCTRSGFGTDGGLLAPVGAVGLARVAGAGGVRMRESGPEHARFGEGEVDVALPGGA